MKREVVCSLWLAGLVLALVGTTASEEANEAAQGFDSTDLAQRTRRSVEDDDFERTIKTDERPNIVRFGRSLFGGSIRPGQQQSFNRFGKRSVFGGQPSHQQTFIRWGRALPVNFIRFRRSAEQTNRAKLNVDVSNVPNFMRVGRQISSPNFMRFGRANKKAPTPNFMRFGKKAASAAPNFMRMGKRGDDEEKREFNEMDKRKTNFIRFGRAPQPNFMRMGKRSADLAQTEKRSDRAKRSADAEMLSEARLYRRAAASPVRFLRLGRSNNGPIDGPNFLRMGRQPPSFIRFGKRASLPSAVVLLSESPTSSDLDDLMS